MSILCHTCETSCQGSIFNNCITQNHEDFYTNTCRQIRACCTGDKIKDSGIKSLPCQGQCLTAWTYNKVNLEDTNSNSHFLQENYKSIVRGCSTDPNLLLTFDMQARSNLDNGFIEDTVCLDLCTDTCVCDVNECNYHSYRNNCREIFTGFQISLVLVFLSLCVLSVVQEYVWKKYFIDVWKNKVKQTMMGDVRHGQGLNYED